MSVSESEIVPTHNPKAEAWDYIGAEFWRNADKDGRPSEREIEIYLDGVREGDRVAIIGASTYYLICKALERGADVTVFDFSRRMIADLVQALGPNKCSIRLHDITTSIPAQEQDHYDYVMADRLINRMDVGEVVPAFTEMARLLRRSGKLRLCIKMGLYRIDFPIIEEGRQLGIVDQFFDENQWTFNFTAAGPLLEKHMKPYGDVSRETLLRWYRHRGTEKRFRQQDLYHYAAQVRLVERGLALLASTPFPDSFNCWFHEFRVVTR